MFTILDYSSALEYSIIRRYTNIVYYYKRELSNVCIIKNYNNINVRISSSFLQYTHT